MLVYWLMLLVPSWAALERRRLRESQSKLVWFFMGLIFTVVIGLRSWVGGDWHAYSELFVWAGTLPFAEVNRQLGDPGYYGLGWIIARAGGNIYLLNLACAALLIAGTFSLARRQPSPWLAIVAAVPYLLIVVGMGYTRQSAAIGLSMLAFVALGDGRMRAFVIWILLATLFHKTAIILIPIAALSVSKRRVWTVLWSGAIFAVAAWQFASDSTEALWANYVESDYADASQGAGIRVAMNVIPAILLFLFRSKLFPEPGERRLWTLIALLSVLSVGFLSVSATAADRLALYFIPLQLVVFSRFHRVVPTPLGRTAVVLGVIVYYAFVQFVWLNYAGHSFAWVPYNFMRVW